MKTVILTVTALVMFVGVSMAEYVSPYVTRDGRHVSGYYRSDSNETVRDNYSYEKNTNPYTGIEGTNKYKNNKSSEYYEKSYKDYWGD